MPVPSGLLPDHAQSINLMLPKTMLFQKIARSAVTLLATAAPFLAACPSAESAGPSTAAPSMETRKAQSGVSYRLWHQGSLAAEFHVTRPNQADKKIQLCIPAAFTTYDNKIDGVYVSNGTPGNLDKVNNKFGGVLLITDGKCKIFPATRGAILPPALLSELTAQKGSFIQQFQVVVNGKGERFSDNSLFQRRGIAILSNGGTAVIESQTPITLTEFGRDAAELGAQQLIYTDMGPWSEGWYRDQRGQTVVIGNDRTLTYRQTNWFIWRAK